MSDFRRKLISIANFIQVLAILGLTIYGWLLGYPAARAMDNPIYAIGGAVLGFAIGIMSAGILFTLTEIMDNVSQARLLLELLNRRAAATIAAE